MVEMTRKSCTGEGFGAKLAQGSYRLAESYGHPEFSMTVKKQEMPAYDPRGVQGIGLNYATGNRGGCHVRGYTIAIEVLQNGAVMDPHVGPSRHRSAAPRWRSCSRARGSRRGCRWRS